jgi:hypothetical protein
MLFISLDNKTQNYFICLNECRFKMLKNSLVNIFYINLIVRLN